MLSAETRDIFALCVLAAIGSSLAGRIMLMMRRSPLSPLQSTLFAVNYTLARILWRVEIRGSLPELKTERGAVLVCNHRCPLDPAVIALTGPRVIHWMVAREYCEYPLFRGLLRVCGAIPVARGETDTTATKTAVQLLERGEIVGFFPEGRLNTTARTLLPGRPGAALIALKGRAAVVPCYIDGTPYDGTTLGCLLMPARVKLTIGEPINTEPYLDCPHQRAAADELTSRLLGAIARLAGDAHYQPEVAGRRPANQLRNC